MDFKINNIKPDDINIDPRTICGLMGIDPDDIPEPYNGIIKRELKEMVRGLKSAKNEYGIENADWKEFKIFWRLANILNVYL